MKYLIFLIIISCSRLRIENRNQAMRMYDGKINFVDNVSADSFFEALKRNIIQLEMQSSLQVLEFGKFKINKIDYINSLKKIEENKSSWKEYIRDHFILMEVYGKDSWGGIFSTGYYSPTIMGSTFETKNYDQALYNDPGDIVKIDLTSFQDRFSENVSGKSLVGRIENGRLLPYFTREEIDSKQRLSGKKHEICFVNSIDAFFLQIQGSGTVLLEDGRKLQLVYANQNGHPYQAIGKFLTKHIPIEEMSMARIRKYLEQLSKDEKAEILKMNPSYVFFKDSKVGSLTSFGTEAVGERTIATDKKFFPAGALAYLDIETPQLFEGKMIYQHNPRFVFDQDTGGAIKGPGRIDLFFGITKDAEERAGIMKKSGKLYYLIPKLP